MKDYYAILQIPGNATKPDIQAAYRRLAKKYHPDVNKNEGAHEKFCEITEAYEFLLNHDLERTAPTIRDKKYATYRDSEEYKRFSREVRERAQKQAKMRYEKFRQQHEAFQTSGINDLGLLLKIILRTTGVLLLFFIAILPVFLAIQFGLIMLVLSLVCWPLAGIIGLYIYDNRRSYFIPGKFYYSPDRIRHLFTDTHHTAEFCFYCPRRTADSVPYKLELFKLKDLKLNTGGFRQHNVHYVNKTACTLIPRSQKAFVLHTVNTLIKMASLIFCLLFLPVSSIVWRFIGGMLAGGIMTSVMFIVSRTRSNVSYLVSYGMICRVFLWIFVIALVSNFGLNPFNISTSDSIQFVVTSIFIFDCLIMQFLELIMGKYASRPVARQFPEVIRKMESGYLVYNDIPFISVAYPLIKWFFG